MSTGECTSTGERLRKGERPRIAKPLRTAKRLRAAKRTRKVKKHNALGDDLIQGTASSMIAKVSEIMLSGGMGFGPCALVPIGI